MRVLRRGSKGNDVKQWELFLHGGGFIFTELRDGVFDTETEKLTKEFQKKNKLVADGIVGNATFGVAMQQGLWKAWDRRDLLKHILSFDGAYAPRFIRCSGKTLSNHAFGTAFDVNADQNPLGAQPALPGRKGCLFELVPIAHHFGFYWGGHFSRRDGMHFEIAKRFSDAEVAGLLKTF